MTLADAVETPDGLEPTHQVLLRDIDWATYVHLRQITDDSGSHVRMVYDDGALLIEMPNKFHEVVKAFVGRLLEAYLEHREIDYAPIGSTTWRRELKRKGIEADECYYIQHVAIADNSEDVNLDIDPPPDLAIEIEASRPLLPKLPVYAAIGVPEIWHLRGWSDVRFLKLDAVTATYSEVSTSLAVPTLTSSQLREWLGIRRTSPFTTALRACRARFDENG